MDEEVEDYCVHATQALGPREWGRKPEAQANQPPIKDKPPWRHYSRAD